MIFVYGAEKVEGGRHAIYLWVVSVVVASCIAAFKSVRQEHLFGCLCHVAAYISSADEQSTSLACILREPVLNDRRECLVILDAVTVVLLKSEEYIHNRVFLNIYPSCLYRFVGTAYKGVSA